MVNDMASYINRGESVFFQFRDGKSVLNSQCKPRMFKTAEKATLGINYIDTDEIVEYAEVVHGRWGKNAESDNIVYCDQCLMPQDMPTSYCHHCGAKMDGVHGDRS